MAQRGFIGRLLLILVAVFLVASYYNVDLKAAIDGFANSPATRKNFEYLADIGKNVWKGYLEEPTRYFLNNVVSNLVKDSFKQNLDNIRALKEGNYDALKLAPAFPQNLVPSLGECANGYC